MVIYKVLIRNGREGGGYLRYLLLCQKTNVYLYFIDSTRITSYERITTRTSNSTVSDVTISFKKNTLDFTGDNNKLSDTTLAYLPSNIDLFKNNLVVHVIISLIGVFVFFFAIFVVTYIYFKCFRKTTNTSAFKETEWQAQYKTLSFDAVEPQLIPLHPEQQGRVNTDFTYLTPVFSGNESRESRRTGENDRRKENEVIIPETHLQVQRVSSQETISRQNEPSIGHDDVQEHVYIEITEEKTESSKLNADPENENRKATCTIAIKEEL